MLMDDENPETLFDFDLGHNNDEWLDIKHLQIVNRLKPGTNKSLQWIFEDTAWQLLEKFSEFATVVKCDVDHNFLVGYITRFMQIRKRNCSKFKRNQRVEGSAIPLFASLLSHSCDPNIAIVCVDNKFACVVLTPIAKHQQLFVCYT
jgi:SET domain